MNRELATTILPGVNAQHREQMEAIADLKATLVAALQHLNRRVEIMAVDLSKLQAVTQQIKDDVKKVIDRLNSIDTSDPAATQTAIDQVVADLSGVRDAIEAV